MSSLLSQFPTLNKTVLTASNQSLKPKPASVKSSSKDVKPAAAVSKKAVKPKAASTATNSAIGAALSAKFGLSFGTIKSGVKRKAVDEPLETQQVVSSKVNQQVRVHDSDDDDDDDVSENNDFDDDLDLAALSKTPGFELDLDDDDDIELEKLLQAKPISSAPSSTLVSATRKNAAAKKGKIASVKAVNSAAAVVVFNDANVGKRDPSLGGAREWRTFMASDVSKLTAEPKPKPPMSAEDEELEKKDDENDRELLDLIRSSKLIEDFTASELTGRERRSYLEKKMIDLGAKKAPNAKAPFPMRLGMIRAEGERAAKRVQTAKDMGLYHSSLKTQILAGDDKERAMKLSKKGSGSSKKGGDLKALDGGVGRFRNGTLHIGKGAADVVSQMGGGKKGRGRMIGMGIKITGVSAGGGGKGGAKKGGKKFKKKR
ncbi:hypothetical protein CcCBS67573_g09992 [Chytriomyces confervae]|uniref:Uncharacterized protein n=1 Tax=Chytriomyces confervae TaxID=246404 RepID=A0A507DKD4_9FUNG|nr:hypothetical protein CcCBS67573_g09992 [Chytriomyces confervae]